MARVPAGPRINATEFTRRLLWPGTGGVQEHACAGTPTHPIVVAGEVSLRCHVLKMPVRIEHVVFLNRVDLSECRIEGSLHIEGCGFRGGLCLRDIQIKGNLFLKHCALADSERKWLDFRRMTVAGITDFTASTAEVGIDFSNSILEDDLRLDGFDGTAAIREGSTIPSGLPARERVHLQQQMLGKALSFEGMELRGGFYTYPYAGRRMRARGMIDLRARVGGNVNFYAATVVATPETAAVLMESADIGGSVFFRDGTIVVGHINLRVKSIGGQVSFIASLVIAETSRIAVDMDDAHITDGVYFWEGTHITGCIDIRSTVGGGVQFNRVRVEADPHANAVMVGRNLIDGSLLFMDGTYVTGRITIRGHIRGQVAFDATRVATSRSELAIDMESAEVSGSVIFQNLTHVTGRIDLRSTIGGHVNFMAGRVETKKEIVAVDMDGARATGGVFFRDGTLITGRVRMRGIQVGGEVRFDATSTQSKEGDDAVDMTSADVGGAVSLRKGVRINGGFCCHQAVFRKGITTVDSSDKADEVSFPAAGVSRRHILVSGRFDLSFARVRGPATLHGMSIAGPVEAAHLTVHGDLDICGSSIAHTPGVTAALPDANAEWRSFSMQYGVETSDEPRKGVVAEWSKAWSEWDQNESREITGFNAAPGIDLSMARIHGRLRMKSTNLNGHAKLEASRVESDAFFDNTPIAGNVDLRSAEVKGRCFGDETIVADGTAYPCSYGYVDLSFSRLGQVEFRFARHDQTNPERPFAIRPLYVNLTGANVECLRLSGDSRLEMCHGTPDDRRGILVTDGLGFRDVDVGREVYRHGRQYHARDLVRMVVWVILFASALCLGIRSGGEYLGILAVGYFLAVLWVFSGEISSHHPASPVLDMLNQSYPFSRSFYISVENWFRSSGDATSADEVFLMRRRRETATPRTVPKVLTTDPALSERWQPPRRAKWLWNWFVDFSLGFGVRWSRLVHVWILLFLINTSLFLNPNSVEHPLAYVQPAVVHTDETASDRPYWPTEGGTPEAKAWTVVNAGFMALRVQVPLLALAAENDWEPSSRPSPLLGVTYEEIASLMMAVNFVLIPLIVAGLTQQFRTRGDG